LKEKIKLPGVEFTNLFSPNENLPAQKVQHNILLSISPTKLRLKLGSNLFTVRQRSFPKNATNSVRAKKLGKNVDENDPR
jgi:hypothetical protein